MVFDPGAAPRQREQFMAWYFGQVEWSEDHSYKDASVTMPDLRGWYQDIKEQFFPMDGPDSPLNGLPDDSPLWNDNHMTGYSIGRQMIYCTFRWSMAQVARETTVRLAEKHNVGFFDVSAREGLIAFPGESYS